MWGAGDMLLKAEDEETAAVEKLVSDLLQKEYRCAPGACSRLGCCVAFSIASRPYSVAMAV